SVVGFDLNVRLEEPEDDDSVDEVHLDEPPLENESGKAFDLNIPLDEFDAVDFSYIGNDAVSIIFLTEPVEQPHRRKEMTEHLRKQVYQSLLARSNNGKLGKKDTTIVAEQFGLHIRAVQRL
ncbi:hypothetical protein PVAP13_6KG309118, partial [Panicum virgatum]